LPFVSEVKSIDDKFTSPFVAPLLIFRNIFPWAGQGALQQLRKRAYNIHSKPDLTRYT
jgi:hypothetical protein